MTPSQKKVVNAWSLYDWANSAYALVITSTIFPIYYNSVTSSKTTDIVHFIGRDYKNTALYSYALSFSFLIVAFISPILSGIADYSGNKKAFMKFFCFLGSASCSALYFFNGDNLWLGISAFVFAGVGFTGSIVFYNAYLPEIAPPEEADKVSAKGFAMGYIGSSLLLIFNLIMIMMPQLFYNVDGKVHELMQADPLLNAKDALEHAKSYFSGVSSRFSFLLVGIWWAGFALITFYYLPKDIYNRRPTGNVIFKGYKELLLVIKQLAKQDRLKKFLFSYFFYNMGVQTVMYVATLFGDKELKLESGQLITTILIIQFVAIGGAYLFAWLSKKFGNMNAIMIAIIIWIGICIGAYFVYTANQFYIIAFVVGMVMGGIQSLSRSTYSKLLPPTQDHASYFSFFDVCEKIGIMVGTALYGLIEELTGSMRNSIIALTTFFIAGFIFLIIAIRSEKQDLLNAEEHLPDPDLIS
jgi:UMF1 family MFS transporter